ncbi:alpha-ketoacid dehydrogenase subunit beta [Bradyrhizobium sp. 5.13L]
MSATAPAPLVKSTERLTFLQAITQAQIEEMQRDKRVIMMGEDLTVYGSGKIVQNFGPDRVWCTPISETSFTGVGIGAAIAGLRPIIELSISSFMYLASDPIINQAAKLRYMTGGQVQIPIVIRFGMYYGRGLAAQHSDRPYPMFMNVPGLKIISPSRPCDVKGLLKSAIRDNDPVLFCEDTTLWTMKGEVPTDTDYLVPIGKALVERQGSDVTIVAIAGAMRPAREATEALAAEGISAELIDPRTLKPLDTETILGSVAKTGRLVLVENAHRICGLTSEIAAIVAAEGFEYLKRPIRQLAVPDVHIPFAQVLENSLYPSKDDIVAAARSLI